MRKPYDVTVIGGGLVGLAISTLLSRQGMSVLAIEARAEPSERVAEIGRSINLTLCARGIVALDAMGLGSRVGPCLVPVVGRMLHFLDGRQERQPYDLVGHEAIFSIQRSVLQELLLAGAKDAGVDLQFLRKCVAVDPDNKTLSLIDERDAIATLNYQTLICADGAHSSTRHALSQRFEFDSKIETLGHGYKELALDAQFGNGLDPNYVHVWPRGDKFLIAFPNVDGSYSASIFLPLDDVRGLTTQKATLQFFRTFFADFLEMVPAVDVQFFHHATGRVTAVECGRWAFPNALMLLGDAAHAMPPFYGQGLNCALEGCHELANLAKRNCTDWDRLFAEFEHSRRPDVAAASRLSHENHSRLLLGVTADRYRLTRAAEAALQLSSPDHFMPLYAMVAFSTLSYSQALSRAQAQTRAIDSLLTLGPDWSLRDLSIADQLVRANVDHLPPSARPPRKPVWLPMAAEIDDNRALLRSGH